MRTGLTVSVVGHLVLIGWGVISLRSFAPLDANDIEAVPVDLIVTDAVSSIPLGMRTAAAAEQPSPNDPAKVAADKPVPAPEPPAPDPKPPTPPPPPPANEPAPTPPAQPATEPEATPPPPQPDLASEPQPAPKPVPEAEPPPPEEALPPPPQEAAVEPPLPHVRPSRPAPPAESKDFSDEITALLDKSKSASAPAQSEQPASIGAVTGSPFSELRQNDIDALRARLASCWDIPPTRADPAELRVKVKMFLGRDGTLARAPEVVEYHPTQIGQVAAESAIRAVQRCAPFNLPPEKYDSWKEIIVTFDPREMFGG
jgi:hypothetical protein